MATGKVKDMNKRSLLISLTTIALLLTVPLANAKWSHSFGYTVFNTTTKTNYATDKAYSSESTGWQAKIIFAATFNASYAGSVTAEIGFRNSSHATAYIGFTVHFGKGGNLYLDWTDNDGTVRIYSGTFDESGDTVYLTVKNDKGYFGNSTHYNAYIDAYITGTWTYNNTSASGDTDLMTAGYISVEVDTAPLDLSDALEIIYVVIPLIFTVAVLGVVLDMFKDVSK